MRSIHNKRPLFFGLRVSSLATLLFSISTLPPLAIMLLNASSFGLGLALVCFASLVLFLWQSMFVTFDRAIPTSILGFGSIFWSIILGHLLAASFITKFSDWERAIHSLVILSLILAAAAALSVWIRYTKQVVILRAVRLLFFIFIIEAILAIAGVPALGPALHQFPIIFFGEPSWFAINFLPFVIFMVLYEKGWRRFAIVASVLMLALWVESLTLLSGLVLVALLAFSRRHLLLFLITIYLTYYVADLSYFTDRLNFSESNNHLSVLAYIQGWERAAQNLHDTYGMGVGFQQFGLVGSTGEVQQRIYAIYNVSELNLLDGASIGSKLVGEFGLIGIIILLLYIGMMFYAISIYKRTSLADPNRVQKILFIAWIVSAFVELFVRGGGYMSSGMLILFAGVFWIIPAQISPHASRTLHMLISHKVDTSKAVQ